MNEQFGPIEEIFHQARDLEPTERASFLDDACNGDLGLRGEVESLLSHSEYATKRMSLRPTDERAAETIVDRGPLSEGPGTKIGPYKILQQIGEGGFGVVYMAEQQEPVQRMVALKIIKLGMDTKQVIARFEAERQALALMDHPNIATVLEAGATVTGRPYFVMELVKGMPITEYCDKQRLSVRDRLALFIEVCHAVQHAHQKGIIHRDLKPSNVLVTLHDTKAVPKVIDFGIAKATSRSLTEKTLFTEFRQLVGTPEYMSPDQAEISGLDVDTRTDIYSLGVLLYELLTGTTPLDSTTLRTAAYAEIQRIIQEVDPPKPSTRLQTIITTESDSGASVARRHGAEPGALSRLMRGDIDWIVMRAMEKDRTRRYQSASELIADIERYLTRQPVLAGPPSVIYKMRKFVLRHRIGVTAGLLVAGALVVGLTAAAFGFVQARQEARRSQEIADFLQDLFVSADPEGALDQNLDVERVLATAREVFGEDHATVAATLSSRALQLQSSGDLEAAERLYQESVRIWIEQLGPDNINVGTNYSRLGILQVTKGDDAAAEAALREALRIGRLNPDREGVEACTTASVLAGILANRGQTDEAIELLRESIRIRKAVAPRQKLQLASTVNALANILVMSGRDDAVAETMPEVLSTWRAALPKDSPFLARVLTECAAYFIQHEKLDEADKLLLDARTIYRRSDEPAGLYRGLMTRLLAHVVSERDGPVAALAIALEGLDDADRFDDEKNRDQALDGLAKLSWSIAIDSEHASSDYRAALEAVERVLEYRPEARATLNTHGVLLYRVERFEDALEALAKSHALYAVEFEGGVPADLAFTAMSQYRLGRVEEAKATLETLRSVMSIPENARRASSRDHFAEAETLIDSK